MLWRRGWRAQYRRHRDICATLFDDEPPSGLIGWSAANDEGVTDTTA
jgi:hypothetical protein